MHRTRALVQNGLGGIVSKVDMRQTSNYNQVVGRDEDAGRYRGVRREKGVRVSQFSDFGGFGGTSSQVR